MRACAYRLSESSETNTLRAESLCDRLGRIMGVPVWSGAAGDHGSDHRSAHLQSEVCTAVRCGCGCAHLRCRRCGCAHLQSESILVTTQCAFFPSISREQKHPKKTRLCAPSVRRRHQSAGRSDPTQSMQQTWTVLHIVVPDHLGLWDMAGRRRLPSARDGLRRAVEALLGAAGGQTPGSLEMSGRGSHRQFRDERTDLGSLESARNTRVRGVPGKAGGQSTRH